MGTCRVCGCTEDRACVRFPLGGLGEDPETCAWAEPDLCTACAPDAAADWVHPDEQAAAATIAE